MRDVGELGENEFKAWCTSAELVANKATIDKTGWDFLVEFLYDNNDSSVLVDEPVFECRVQVKSTDREDKKEQIKLSNMKRLATAQIPSFIVFIEYDGKSTAQNAYVVHVDFSLITHVIKRLHKANQAESGPKLNKRTVTVRYDDSHKLRKVNGVELKRTLQRHIGVSMSQYVSQKVAHLKSTGYEDQWGTISFSSHDESAVKQMIDVSLGLKESVEVTNLIGTKIRFGIPEVTPFLKTDVAKLSMPGKVPFLKGIAKFKQLDSDITYTFGTKLLASPFNQHVSKKFVKYRVQGAFFDIEFSPFAEQTKFTFFFNEELRLNIEIFRDAVHLLNLLHSGAENLSIEMRHEQFPDFHFDIKARCEPGKFLREKQILDSAYGIASYLNMKGLVELSTDELIKNEKDILQMAKLVSSPNRNFQIEFVDEDELDLSVDNIIIYVVKARLGEFTIVILLSVAGKAEQKHENGYCISGIGTKVEKSIIFKDPDVADNSSIKKAILEIERQYNDTHRVMCAFEG